MRGLLLRLVFGFALLAAAGCARERPRAPLVLAAASLQEVMHDAADAWAAQGHARPVLSFAASSALARQIESEAAADLFVSADAGWASPRTAAAVMTKCDVRMILSSEWRWLALCFAKSIIVITHLGP